VGIGRPVVISASTPPVTRFEASQVRIPPLDRAVGRPTEPPVKTHLLHVFAKLGVASRAEPAALATRKQASEE
jgi:hypothetical protein